MLNDSPSLLHGSIMPKKPTPAELYVLEISSSLASVKKKKNPKIGQFEKKKEQCNVVFVFRLGLKMSCGWQTTLETVHNAMLYVD